MFALGEDCDVGVIAFVGKERSYAGSSAGRVVVCELSKGKDFRPIVLLVVAENAKVLVRATPKSNSVDNVRALQGDATVLE